MLRFKRVYNLSMVQKIALAGIFIILIALFQKIFAVNYIPVLPFVRISFGGPALIIFSSILLGPWFGLLVGAASDIVGFYIFDPKMFGSAPFFQITFIYALLGFASFFIYKFFQVVKNEKLLLTIEVVVFTLLLIGLTLFSALDYQVDLAIVYRILIPLGSLILLALTLFTQLFVSRYFKKREININVSSIGFACFVIEMTIMIAFGVLMKWWAFSGSTFIIILVSQIIVAFFNIPLNTFLVSYIMYLSNKLIKQKG
ncbi:MAG: hypothetical protein IJQ72_02495 [Bacilli bacterium]|nr:hypothetical protein [Bacilli bacterium]